MRNVLANLYISALVVLSSINSVGLGKRIVIGIGTGLGTGIGIGVNEIPNNPQGSAAENG
jgi:hypothetical protein